MHIFFSNKSLNILSLFLFLILFFTNSSAKTIEVSKSGKFTSIKAAISSAQNGDKIIVNVGRYAEGNIIIDKELTFIGLNFPVIDGEGETEVFTITANNVTIKGFEISNAGISYMQENAGVKLDEVSGCNITDNRFINNFFAIYLAKSADCKITNNYIKAIKKRETNSGNGIHLWYCKNILIEQNEISNHRDGIYFEFVENGKILNNISENNLRYGLHFMFSDRCEYIGNTFQNNGAGVAVMYTKNILMKDNLFIENWGPASYGILLKDISDSKIINNRILKNSVGVYIEGCNRLIIKENDFIDNGWAVKLMANSMNNEFLQNNFSNNSFDIATNSRHNFNLFNKNYWDRYDGYDLNKDGIGDIPFRPVTMFSFIIETQPTALVLMNSLFVHVLNVAESVVPSIIPSELRDLNPQMRYIN